MGIVYKQNVPPEQIEALIDVLHEIHTSNDRLARDIILAIRSSLTRDQVLITKGLIYDDNDHLGEYHFDIRIKRNNIMGSIIHHVYVMPVYTKNNRWIYKFKYLT